MSICEQHLSSMDKPLSQEQFRCQLYTCLRFYKIFPTVCASSDVHGEEVNVLTSIDQLEYARPKVVVTEDEVKNVIDSETGRDRLRAMFSKDRNGDISGDLANVFQIAQTCGLFFFLVTSVAGGVQARDLYMQKNKSTVYATKFQAVRSYNDAVLFGSMRFGLKWGLKSALFAGIFTMTSQTISVYRNRTSVIDYTVGGGLTCALLRMNMGLRGIFAGGVIGSGLGLIGGAVMCSLLYLTNETQQHRHFLYIHQLLREKREAEQLSGKVTAQSSIGDLITDTVDGAS